MKGYVKCYFQMHLKHWYLYIINIIIMIIAFFTSLIAAKYFDVMTKNVQMMWFLCALTFAVISSWLLLIPNIMVARKYRDKGRCYQFLLVVVNQFISILCFYFIGHMIYFTY
ncbi:uncharacterized membrane protein YhaH (DUF805 family) [Priestia taiwanensis]|uniref:Uncharacterized protein n=1 Tax=Priestia taiwanensis TaxID=1347902 RepID=A0A917AY13_9BACI|nr:uncharacterized membrane protein YhaH (DUF805 family) [Priestia taiwanensis]GGE79488.1 hypothetical protein GCM10007140_31350 [Priestia taiwanensis]